jgi:circadian clock protein KaiC
MDRAAKASSGIEGLDNVTAGGFACGRVFLIEGEPGTGKTTIASQFLMQGAQIGERGLYITLSETEEELREAAISHGWTFGPDFHIYELVPLESLLDEHQQQSLLYSSDLELGETTRRILAAIERIKPQRVVIDSLSEIRLLAQASLRYRRQILALKHYFAKHNATVLMLDDLTSDAADKTVHSVAHGVLRLEQLSPNYGAERRRLRILKYRGQRFRGGFHDFVIKAGGARVFPRLVSLEHKTAFARDVVPTDNDQLNALLGGGIDAGTSTLILGPTGTGKSVLALTLIRSCIARGEKAAMFVFDEEVGLLIERAMSLGIDIRRFVADGMLALEQVDAAELSPGEFAHRVRAAVERNGIRTVVIDSLNGYHAAMPEEGSLVLHMHELLQYLNRSGANTFLTVAQHGLVGDMQTPVDITYLADTVVLLRYFEAAGHVRRAISIVKKRSGVHENTIREYRIDGDGVTIGEPLTRFQGVLRGVPTMIGDGKLMNLDTEQPAG